MIQVGDKVIDTNWLEEIYEVLAINESLNMVQISDKDGSVRYTNSSNLTKTDDIPMINPDKLVAGDIVEYKTNPNGTFEIEGIAESGPKDTLYILKDTDGMKCWGRFLRLVEKEEILTHEEVWDSEDFLDEVNDWYEEEEDTPQKFDAGKPMIHLVRPEFITGIASGLTYGFEKYSETRGDINFLRGEGHSYTKVYDSLQRHLMAWSMGEEIDPESGVHHLSLAGANLMFLHTYEHSDKGVDDRILLDKKKKD